MIVFYSTTARVTQSQIETNQIHQVKKGYDALFFDNCNGMIPIWERLEGKKLKELIDG